MADRSRHAEGLHDLCGELIVQLIELFKRNPMNAVDRAGLNRFLNQLCAVTVLANSAGATVTGLNHKRIGGDMSAVTASDADGFIDPNSFLSKGTA